MPGHQEQLADGPGLKSTWEKELALAAIAELLDSKRRPGISGSRSAVSLRKWESRAGEDASRNNSCYVQLTLRKSDRGGEYTYS